jgi:hypothetical protein
VAGKIGLGVASDYARARSGTQLALASRRAAGVTLDDLGQVQCGIVSFTVARQTASAVRDLLCARQINVSVSRLSSTRLDMSVGGLGELIGTVVHYDTTEEELDQLFAALRSL